MRVSINNTFISEALKAQVPYISGGYNHGVGSRVALKDTLISGEIKTTLATTSYYDWDPNDTEPMYKCIFVSIARFLHYIKQADGGKVALAVDDYKGNMLMAAIVTHTPNDDPSMPGNWSLSFTFDPEDIKEINPVMRTNEAYFHKVLAETTIDIMHCRYTNTAFQEDITKLCVINLKDCLDKNANPDDVYEIEVPDIFVARVAIEDGEVVKSIEPSSKLSQIIKGDDQVEVA